MTTPEISTGDPNAEATGVSPEEIATVINKIVALVRLIRHGVSNPTPEQVKEEADKIPNSLVGQGLKQVEARQQFNLDLVEGIGTLLGAE